MLLGMLVLTTVVVMRWAWPTIEAARMEPRVAFEALPALRPGTYDNAAMWVSRPDLITSPARFRPAGLAPDVPGTAQVFFLHPTTFLGRNHWNAPLDHPESRTRTDLLLRSMASAFNAEAGIWAPRYRQAALGSFMSDQPQAKEALALAEGDARQAFATFLHRIPPDAPIMLVGHGQGALITLHLLRDMVRGTAVAPRVMAVYLTGWPVSAVHDLPQTGMAACTHGDQADCVMAWMTFADPADARQVNAMASHYPLLDGTYPDAAPVCTNPLTGGLGTRAPVNANRGSLTSGDEARVPVLIMPSVGARCLNGLLMVDDPPTLGDEVLPGNNYTLYDLALFWRNVRADVAGRDAAWQRDHHRK